MHLVGILVACSHLSIQFDTLDSQSFLQPRPKQNRRNMPSLHWSIQFYFALNHHASSSHSQTTQDDVELIDKLIVIVERGGTSWVPAQFSQMMWGFLHVENTTCVVRQQARKICLQWMILRSWKDLWMIIESYKWHVYSSKSWYQSRPLPTNFKNVDSTIRPIPDCRSR